MEVAVPSTSTTRGDQDPPPTTMKKTNFTHLSTDIKALIADNVLRPSDLQNLCLVNKQMHELAVKPLYHTVALHLGSEHDHRLSAFLNPRNIGLQHIRHIRLHLAHVDDDTNQEQQVSLVVKMLLEFLPEDILKEFTWCPWKPFSAENLLLLYKKQRKMKWLEVMDLDTDILPRLKKDDKLQANIFPSATKLSLYPENRKTLRLAGFFMEKTADRLEELIIHTDFAKSANLRHSGRNTEYIEPSELNDSAVQPGLLTSSIFAPMLPFDRCEPFKNLKFLRLENVNLRHSETTWCKFVNFREIDALHFHHCAGADSLLGQLSKAAHLPKKLTQFHFQHVDGADNDALLAVDGFLCLTSGIRELVIDLKGVNTMVAAAGIARHAKTLELLNVHCSPTASSSPISSTVDWTDELTWDNEAFTKICESCTKLEQLSCAWPATSVIRAASDEWEHFEMEVEDLKELITLHISNYPTNKPSSQPLPRTIYAQLLQGLATRLFHPAVDSGDDSASNDNDTDPSPDQQQDAPSPSDRQDASSSAGKQKKLRVIAFGINPRIHEREDSKAMMIYVRSHAFDADGKAKPFAAPTSWCVRRFLEPASDILDIMLPRCCKLPWRGEGGSVAGMPWGGGDDDEFDDV